MASSGSLSTQLGRFDGKDAVPSSSPAFETPAIPVNLRRSESRPQASVLPILLPAATLRPIAFRIFTKRHNLNLNASALELLSAFVGRHCGSGWREDSLAGRLLDETARRWKKQGGSTLVSGEDGELNRILNLVHGHSDPRVENWPHDTTESRHLALHHEARSLSETTGKIDAVTAGALELLPQDAAADDSSFADARQWLKVVDACSQPQLLYNPTRKHFENFTSQHSLLPAASQKTQAFRQRYHLVHQRLLRNESFQVSAVQSLTNQSSRKSGVTPGAAQQAYKLTQIANLLGRGGTMHVLLGMLARSPAGYLTITDPSGSIVIDLQYAHAPSAVWYTPGMMVVIEGHYEDGQSKAAASLDGISGVGGTIGGIFVAFAMTGPPSEPRDVTLGTLNKSDSQHLTAANFGWVDFLGTGSDRAVGQSMRDTEAKVLRKNEQGNAGEGRHRLVVLGETNLDVPQTITALRKILALYASESANDTPIAFVLVGNFVHHAGMVGQGSEGSIAYKEFFDSLALALSDYPTILQNTTLIFVPGDNDPWASSISAGSSSLLPHDAIPEVFTSRIRRVFLNANNESERVNGRKSTGEAIWSTNPTRLSLFGPCIEIAIFRDDMLGRLRRNAIDLVPAKETSTTNVSLENVRRSGSQDQGTETSLNDIEAPVDSADVGTEPAHDVGPSAETLTARKLVKTIIDQGHLSPFPTSKRPVRSELAGALHLYPLPTAIIMMDAEAPPFALSLDGCWVMNPGPLTALHRKNTAQWLEYNIKTRRGRLKQLRL